MTEMERLILMTLHTNSRMLQRILFRLRRGEEADYIDSLGQDFEQKLQTQAQDNEQEIISLLDKGKLNR